MPIPGPIEAVARTVPGAERSRSGNPEWYAPCPLCGGEVKVLRIHQFRSGMVGLECHRQPHTEEEIISVLRRAGHWWPRRDNVQEAKPEAAGKVVDLAERRAEQEARRAPDAGEGDGTIEPLFDPAEVSVGRMLDTEPPARRWLLDGILPQNVEALLAGAGGVSKSFLMLQLLVATVTGRPFLGIPVKEPGAAFLLAAEDDIDELHRRLVRIVRHLRERGEFGEAEEEKVRERLFLLSRAGTDSRLTAELYGQTVRTTMGRRMTAALEQLPAVKLVVLDPVSRFRSGDENDNEAATRFVEAVAEIRAATEATVLLPHHVTKDGLKAGTERLSADMLRGASGLVDGVRWAAVMASLRRDIASKYGVDPDDAGRFVRFDIVKNNYAPPWAGLWLERTEGGVLVPTELSEGAAGPAVSAEQYRDILQRAQGIIRRDGAMSPTQLRDKYGGKGGELGAHDRAVWDAIRRAVKDGHLVERPGPRRGVLLCLPDPENDRV